ncbi:CDC25-like phosphatase YCH1 like protein [Zymoseptoria brevis]|uniref:CDC25-like phosphatase YCH1 like protein n=1 Tax=Zymoseptoria brevis TaxID=1047168 RepID=A0A0F4G838_9PEZI|nr:CDC25-like phosphatase YCH1 like protein [Zymoseptoria brevis]
MSMYTIPNLPRISREELATLLKSKTPNLTIVDVRDNDYIGGHILGCKHVPVNEHDYRMPELIRTLKDEETVVFHCTLSQQRGPSSALRYLRERDALLGDLKKQDGEQKVYVLEGGFQKWQEKYGEDKELTEGYEKDLWE